MHAVVVEAGQSRQATCHRRRRGGTPSAGLRRHRQVTDPGVDVVALRGQGMDAELLTPARPRLLATEDFGRAQLLEALLRDALEGGLSFQDSAVEGTEA